MDIDFDDLDGPSKAPATKPGKFAPKNSKFKPVAKPKKEPEASAPSSQSNTAAIPNLELIDCKTESEQPSNTVTAHDTNSSMKNDTDTTDMEVDNDQEQDEEDKVVREIDVFFTSSVDADSKLYVLQYPLRPTWRPYDLEERCEKVRVKPETAEVEIEMSIQADSENFDADVDDDKAMSKQVLSTKWRPTAQTGYAVGILMGNELHLNPVHAVVQLRPSLKHQQPLKQANTTHDEDMIAAPSIKNEKAIKQSKKQGQLPGAAIDQNTDTKEQWIPLKYHGEASQLSRQYMENMVVRNESQIQYSMSQSDYIDLLCPPPSGKPRAKAISQSSLLKLPLEERFKTRLLEGPAVHRFNAFKHIAPNDSDEDIFSVLQKYAQLVQGLWIAKSKLKYGKDEGKELLLRDYVMLQLSKNPIFQEVQLPKSTSLSETMKGVLDEFAARRDSCRDWKFRECTDDSFIKKYPDIVKKQKEIWDRVEPNIVERLFPKNFKNIGDRRPASVSTNDVAQRITNVPPSRTLMLEETREALPKALQKLFQAYKVCSINQIRQRLRDMAVSENTHRKGTREAKAAAAAADATLEDLQKALNEVAVNIHGAFVLRKSPDYPQYDHVRKIVIDLFLAEGPKGRLKKASIYAAANMELKRDLTNAEYQKVLNELCVSQNSAWVLKSGDGPT